MENTNWDCISRHESFKSVTRDDCIQFVKSIGCVIHDQSVWTMYMTKAINSETFQSTLFRDFSIQVQVK